MSSDRDKLKSLGSFHEINGMVLDQDKEYYDMINIHIKSLADKEPVEINFEDELINFLGGGLLRPFDNEMIKVHYLKIVSEKRVSKLAKLCFWEIMASRFPETVESEAQEEVQSYYQKKVSRQYVKLFQRLPEPKNDLITLVIFTVSYLIHFVFYKYFSPQREYFNLRFILNCYHTVLFEFNGLFVSDFYIKSMIEKIFTQRFLDYEKKNMKELLQRQIELKKMNDRSFLGFQLKFPDIIGSKDSREAQDASEFKDKIMTMLKRDKKFLSFGSKSVPKPQRPKGESNKRGEEEEFKRESEKQEDITTSNTNLKLNCNQVSPTFGRVLEYENLNLPYKKKKMIKHQFERIDENPSQLLNQMKSMFTDKNENNNKKKEHKVQTKGKSIIDQYGFHGPSKEYYDRHSPRTSPLFKDMLDINYILAQQNQEISKQPTLEEIQQLHQNKQGNQMTFRLAQQQMESKVEDQIKQIQVIQNLQAEQGNQDIFDMPFKGTRSERRKLIAYVRDKCRKKLDEADTEEIKQEEPEIKTNKRNKSEYLKVNSPLTLPPITQRPPELQVGSMTMTSGEKKDIINTVTFNLKSVSSLLQRENSIFQSSKFDPSKLTKDKYDEYASPSVQQSLAFDNMMEHQRKVVSKILNREEVQKPSHHGNLPEYILQRALDSDVTYVDKRKDYRHKYNNIFNSISVDQNINDLFLNILQKRNMLSHGKKSKH